MSSTINTAFTALCIAVAFSGAAEAGKIFTGGARGSYNGDFCPQLSSELAKAKFNYSCTPSLGSTENMEKVRQSPTDVGFAQFDVFTLEATNSQQSHPFKIVRTDLAKECLFMVTRNKQLKSYGDVVALADQLRFILPPVGSGSASTFDYLRHIDPSGLGRTTNITHADTTDIALQRALDDEESVSLFVQFPNPDSDRFKMVNKAGGFFVPVIDRHILRRQIGDQKVYYAEETEVSNAKFWKKGESVVTACTPMILFTGNPDLMPSNNDRLDQADLVRTIETMTLDSLRPKKGWLSTYWSKTRALSAEAVEKMVATTETAREKAAPYVEKAKELKEKAVNKAKELGEKASPVYEDAKAKAKELGDQAVGRTKELGEKASPYYETVKERARELKDKAVNKAKELGDAAKDRLQQQ